MVLNTSLLLLSRDFFELLIPVVEFCKCYLFRIAQHLVVVIIVWHYWVNLPKYFYQAFSLEINIKPGNNDYISIPGAYTDISN